MANNKTKSGRKQRKLARGGKFSLYCAPFPPIRRARFNYTETLSIVEAVAGSGGILFFTPSSLFDPNNSGVGHQPMYYDQLCSSTGPYTRYRALHTVAKITFANTTAIATQVGYYVSPSGTTPTNVTTCMEKPWGRWSWVSGTSGGPTIQKFVADIDHAKALGITKRHLMTDDYYAGAYNSSPAFNYFLCFYAFGIGGNLANCYATVELQIDAEVFGTTATPTS